MYVCAYASVRECVCVCVDIQKEVEAIHGKVMHVQNIPTKETCIPAKETHNLAEETFTFPQNGRHIKDRRRPIFQKKRPIHGSFVGIDPHR